ncbi:MFS drug efflux transporter [Aspergillus heteromorphus CBS 117.55]|uniref:MFS drug efflux transporter n=1 Tax=Aspergillus heteromorphus CBS 117.55 TaxID=1448321 RepID=A0A317VGI1_9EURO|nr:MFS drug efflux transporter [Aspergillus heteromorphus CBS 117.55]PWY73025.1 MFS drug efflux transporter [Aspergillus heteromorphus CBS 117.55]
MSEKAHTVPSLDQEALESHSDSASPEPEAFAPTPKARNPITWVLIVMAIQSSVFLFALDNTITADVIPAVIGRFGGADKIAWLSVAFTMGGVSAVLPFSRLYALFEAKKLYLTSVTLFLVGSALCGGAPSINAFIVGRVIAGVGGIGMYLGVMTLLSVNTSPTTRPMYLGLVGLIFGIGNVVGPVIGGAFTDSSATWRWGFYMNLCIIGVMTPVYIFLIPVFHPTKGRTVGARIAEIDFAGIVLSIGAVVCLIMGINFGGTLYDWNSASTIVLFVVSGVLFIVFAVQQGLALLTTKENRLFPVVFLWNKEAMLLFVLTSTFNAAGFIPIYYIPSYFQFTRGDSALDSGVRLLPLIILISFTIMCNGGYLSKGGYYMPWYVFGSVLTLIGGVLFSRVNVNTSTSAIYGYEVLIGIGAGCGMQTGFAVIQSITKPELMAHGIGFIMIAQLLSVSLALSIAGTVYLNLAIDNFQDLLPGTSKTQIQGALQGLSGSFLDSLSAEQKSKALVIMVNSLSKVYVPVYAGSALGIVAAIFLSRKKMNPAMSM